MNYEEEIEKLWKIRKTVLQMCNDRGYIVTTEELEQTLDQFKEAYPDRTISGEPNRSKLIVLVSHNDDPTNEMYIFFPDESKVGLKTIDEYVVRLKQENINHAIVVYNKAISPGAVKRLKEIEAEVRVELFMDAELITNITTHFLVPQHVVLTFEEKKELLARYKLKEGQLPRISVYDPISRYLGLRVGQIVKIIRLSETAGRYVTYRLVS